MSFKLICAYSQLSVGPEATVSLIVGSGIAHQQAQQKYPFEPEKAAAIASMTALCVGLFTFALGLLRFGFLDSLMSRALLRGFITAVGVVVLVQQFIILLGLGTLSSEAGVTPESTTIERLGFLFTHMKNSHLLTTIISICVLTFLFAVPLLKRYILKKEYRFAKVLCQIPEVLLVVIGSVVVCSLGQFNKSGVEILGKVGEGGSDFHLPLPFPTTPYLPSGADIKTVLINAAMITIIGFVESIAAAKSFARRHNYFVSANRELVAIGIGNIIGSFFQAYPAFGSVSDMCCNSMSH
jgi:MFS superfamily sulfate permease-like transporter